MRMRSLSLVAVLLLAVASVAKASVTFPLEVIERVELSVSPTGAHATVFSVGDAITQTFTLTGAAQRPGGVGIIQHLRCTLSVSGTVGFDVMVFSRSFAGTALNAAWAPTAGDLANSYVGKISIVGSDWVAQGSSAQSAVNEDVDLRFDLPKGSRNLYCQAVLRLGDKAITTDALKFKFDIAWLKD